MIEDDDRGVTLGVGLFETILVSRRTVSRFDAHLDRLTTSCGALGLPSPDRERCRRAVEAAVARLEAGVARAAVRITWTGGRGARGLDPPATVRPALRVRAAPIGPAPVSLDLATSSIRRHSSSPCTRHKTLSYLDNVLARAEARTVGCDEALMLNERRAVAGVAAGNLFVVCDDRLIAPTLGCGSLAGHARARMLDSAAAFGVDACEEVVPTARLRSAQSLIVTNSLIGAAFVGRIDGRALPAPQRALVQLVAWMREV